jgi:hypothetical protein
MVVNKKGNVLLRGFIGRRQPLRLFSPQMTSLHGVSLTYPGLIQKADGGVNGPISPLLNESLLAPDSSTVVIQTRKKIGSVMEALS